MATTGLDRHPTRTELRRAHRIYQEHEPLDVFYRAATDLVALSLQGKTTITLGEALAVLLRTWNRSYYRFHPATRQHARDLDEVLATHRRWLASVRRRTIESFTDEDEARVIGVFDDFEAALGPVGAAKALHLLAPSFLPLWDRAIARTYGLGLARAGRNGPRYVQMIGIAQTQAQRLGGTSAFDGNLLKQIDEYNYCHYTRGWV